MIFTFEIDNDVLNRLSDAMDHPLSGFVFVSGQGTLIEQKKAFFRRQTKQWWSSFVFNIERQKAIESEPADTAAEQANRWVEPVITDNEV